jgi:hypothetical protein
VDLYNKWSCISWINAISILVVVYSYPYIITNYNFIKLWEVKMGRKIFTGLFVLSLFMGLFGCIRKYEVKFDVYPPETLAENATNYQ